MNPADVIALPVLTHQGVVLANHAHSVRPAFAGAAASANRSDRRQRHYPRSDHNFTGGDELPIKLHQAKGINGPYRQWAGGETAAYAPQQGILHDPAPAHIRPIHQESRPVTKLSRN